MSADPFQGALDIARAYRRAETTTREVVGRLLSHIDTHEPKLGAFQAIYADDARLAAEAADKAMRSGHRIGPFHGIPFALKDIVDVEGRITTGGSLTLSQRVSPATATIARRLLSAGGILVGKTKTVEFAMGGWGTNQHMGTPWNPWDLETHRAPGGSSGGSGVAVAAGMVPCAVGTDTGGSVRLPAAFCGIVGLKVTEGTLPTDGIIPLSHTLDTPRPMTRSTADASFMFDVMAGHESASLERHLSEPGSKDGAHNEGVRGLRLGVLSERDRKNAEGEILSLYDAALETLQVLGAELVPFEPPVSYGDIGENSATIFITEGYTHNRTLMEDPTAQVDENVRARFLGRRDVAAHDYISAVLQRSEHIKMFHESMQGIAALLVPTTTSAAVAVSELDQNAPVAWFTRPFNYLAMCGLSVPMGLTDGKLPGGLQIVARGGDEAMALRIGSAFEQAVGRISPPQF